MTGDVSRTSTTKFHGGLYSQMIFGESFQEPARDDPAKLYARAPTALADCGGRCGGLGSGALCR